MKKYIKPAIEELNLGATMPLMASGDEVYNQTGFQEGDSGYTGQLAPGRKGRVYIEDDDDFNEDFGW